MAGFFEETSNYCRKHPSVPVCTLFCIGYTAYYLIYVVKKPHLACSDSRFRQFLQKYVPIIHEKYWPTFWCIESRAQTIIRSLFKSVPSGIEYTSETLDTSDGGKIKLDWVENANSMFPNSNTRPTVLLLPGLTGCSKQSYILHFVQEATWLGYRTVVFNNRGNGGAPLLTPRTYCAANTEDLSFVISHIRKKYTEMPMIGVGISLGGMILFNYLAKTGKDCHLDAGLCVSVAWNVFESSNSLETPVNRYLLNRTLTRTLVENVQQNVGLYKDLEHVDMDHVAKSTTIREFDDRFTSKIFGYPSNDHYYSDATLHNKVHAIEVPVLCLSAADDPFSPEHGIPVEEAENNDNVAILLTSHGGHIGFMEGLFPRHASYMDRVFRQFTDAVFKHGHLHLKQD